MKFRFALILTAALALGGCTPWGLTTEYRTDPVGIDTPKPRLSWKLPDGMKEQAAYEIDAGVWQSGKVESPEHVNVEWGGPELASSQRIEWKVRVWDAEGHCSDWSQPAKFVMGVMKGEDWKAKWIGPNETTRRDEDMAGAKWITGEKDEKGVVTLRRKIVFKGAKPGEFAEMVTAGTPQYEIKVNGKFANLHSGHIWDPRFVRYRDITPWLKVGENDVEVRIVRDATGSVPDGECAFIAKFTMPDGSKTVTDGSWTGAKELGGVRDTAFGKTLVLRHETQSPAFAKEFEVKGPVKTATLHVTGVGLYEASLNGRKIGDKVLDPSPTAYDKRVLYSTYEVEDMLKKGTNTIRVLVGHGWYDVRSIATWNFENAPWRDFPRMIAQLEIEYADGEREIVASDSSWSQVSSPVRYDCIREGEVIDHAQAEPADLPAAEVAGPKGKLVAEACPGAKVMREIEPESVTAFGDGVYVVKFPENFAGWARITFAGQDKGDVVVIRYDERANEDGSPAAPSVRDGLHNRPSVDIGKAKAGDETRRIDCHFRYTASHRVCATGAEFQADRLIFSGADEELYEPRFTYNGFQYVVLKGLKTPPKKVVGCVVHTAFGDIGKFESSDKTLDTLVNMAAKAYKSNFADGYPTDCPHREKNGWTGDASIASELAQYLFENTAAYEKWLQDLADTQLESGDICAIAPTSGWGYKWGNGPAWDSALPMIAWNLYVYRDDRRVVETVYPVLKRYLAFTATKADDADLVSHGLGDWNHVDARHRVATGLTSSCYYYQAQLVAAKMAAVLGRKVETMVFKSGAARTREGINAKYYKGGGVYDNGGQTAQAFPIAFGVVEPSERDAVAAKLVEAVEKTGRHVDVGLLGTKHIFRALSRIGRTDLALATIVNPTKPSMVEWIQKGGTTLWEDWGDGASRNHIMFGDFAGWAYQYLAGIQLPETEDSSSAIPDVSERGFRKVVFAPATVGALSRVSASVDTPYGVYASAWKRLKGGKMVYIFTVPGGCTAVVRIPGREDEEIGPGRHEIEMSTK